MSLTPCPPLAKVAFVLALLISVTSATSSLNTTQTGYNCTSQQSCWPSDEGWSKFNNSLSGNLHITIPLAASCYYDSPYHNSSACAVAEENYIGNQARTEVYGAATGLNWESCLSETCALNIDTLQTLSSQCYLGRLSSLYVDASKVQHVVTAVKFAKMHNLRVTIKNTGHDYLGRSTSPDSLAIWTHNLKNMTYHANFTASNCTASNGHNIGEIGAGAQASDIYTFFQKHGMDVTGGNEGSVGLAGGFGMGGGHGVFGPSYGLMVDNAVEFDVVTADGQLRSINQCNDPDLFWAMRGGGGGTFGVLTSYRFQLHPAVKINAYSFRANFTTKGNETTNYPALEQVLTKHATYQPVWSHNNISGHAYYWPNQAEIYLVLPSNNETALKALTSDFSSFLTNNPDIQVTESNYTTYPTYTDFLQLTESIAARLTPGGVFEALSTRLIPRTLFETNSTIADLVNATIQGIRISNEIVPDGGSFTQLIMTTPVNVQNGNTTSANPAWRSALWHLIMTGGWTEKLSASKEKALQESWLDTVEPLKRLTPGGGCYLNECSYLEPEWQSTYFGANYPELVRVKDKYDPTHFFDCWKCIGWEGPSE
ncbi:hypothetical protein H2204_000438 [Knufia peltigerae]|uniref:FAD-binding PCMH-type domain-containing protein n=1 Tax=Knufia peltigerae TaxID=1002370 RepID=A0AA38YEN0_9EURO|nr:hypothetical protein H2204_000438 [Knufia peltigerae]